jgi:hypothetical protein
MLHGSIACGYGYEDVIRLKSCCLQEMSRKLTQVSSKEILQDLQASAVFLQILQATYHI